MRLTTDPLPGGGVDAATWAAVFAEITGAALVAAVALLILRRNAYAFAIADWR